MASIALTAFVVRCLIQDAMIRTPNMISQNIIPRLIEKGSVFPTTSLTRIRRKRSYWRDIGTIEAFTRQYGPGLRIAGI